jgi:FtsH-binding integral membrane protein
MDTEKQIHLERCMLKGVIGGIALSIVFVALSLTHRGRNICGSSAFSYAACVLLLLQVFSLVVAQARRNKSVAVHRAMCAIGFVWMSMLLMAETSRQNNASVLLSLLACLGILATVAFLANRSGGLREMLPFLVSSVVVIVVLSILNAAVFRSTPAETCISAACVVAFSAFVVYDVKRYTKNLNHALDCFPTCCEGGVYNLWLDFANIFSDLVGSKHSA